MVKRTIKVAIVGSRTFNKYKLLKKKMLYYYDPAQIKEIISGGADGADKLAERFAEEYDIPIKIYKPNWDKYGNKAGAIRNIKIVKRSHEVVAFWDGISKGTKITINLAKKFEKNLTVISFESS